MQTTMFPATIDLLFLASAFPDLGTGLRVLEIRDEDLGLEGVCTPRISIGPAGRYRINRDEDGCQWMHRLFALLIRTGGWVPV